MFIFQRFYESYFFLYLRKNFFSRNSLFLNKNSKVFKIKKVSENLFFKGLLICQEEMTSRSIYSLGNFDWGVDISL